MRPAAFNGKKTKAQVYESPIDPDAAAYLAADTDITNPTYQEAVNRFFKDLKGETNPLYSTSNTYADWKAFYPFMGGTAFGNKWNAKNPVDSDAAFRGVFFGGITHNSNGITGNSINAYMNTFLAPSAELSLNAKSFVCYIGNNLNVLTAAYGSQSGTFVGDALLPRGAGVGYVAISGSTGAGFLNTDSSGLWVITRISSGTILVYRNGVLFQTLLYPSMSQNVDSIVLLARRVGASIAAYSSLNLRFMGIINASLTATQALDISNAVNALQTAQGRNTY